MNIQLFKSFTMKHFKFILKIKVWQLPLYTDNYSWELNLAAIFAWWTNSGKGSWVINSAFLLVKHFCKNSMPTGILFSIICKCLLVPYCHAQQSGNKFKKMDYILVAKSVEFSVLSWANSAIFFSFWLWVWWQERNYQVESNQPNRKLEFEILRNYFKRKKCTKAKLQCIFQSL